MERVDGNVGATKRNSGRDATLAEARHNVDFSSAGQAGLRQPSRQFSQEGFIHVAIIQPG